MAISKKTTPDRNNASSKPQARLLQTVCACNYLHLPLTRQHKLIVFVSRFTTSRLFFAHLEIRPPTFALLIEKFLKERIQNEDSTSVQGIYFFAERTSPLFGKTIFLPLEKNAVLTLRADSLAEFFSEPSLKVF